MCDNPLYKKNPANTLEACIHHTQGMLEINDKISGQWRSEKIDFAISNGFKIVVGGMESVYKIIAPSYLDDDQEVVVSLHVQ